MYVIYRDKGNGPRRFNNKQFESYEQGRQYVRRWFTKNVGADKYNSVVDPFYADKDSGPGFIDKWSRNYPSISILGFSIRKKS